VETREVKGGFLNFLKRIIFGTDDFGETKPSEPTLMRVDTVSNEAQLKIEPQDNALIFSRLLNDADKQVVEVGKRFNLIVKKIEKSDLEIEEILKRFKFRLADFDSLIKSLKIKLSSTDFNYEDSLMLLKDHLLIDLKDFRTDLLILENLKNFPKSVKSLEKDLVRLETKLDFFTKQSKDTKQAIELFKEFNSSLQDLKDYLNTNNDTLNYERIFQFQSQIEKTKNILSDELFRLQGYLKKEDSIIIERGDKDGVRQFSPAGLGASVLRIFYR
jgi:exonuclease VII small subunit